MSKTVLLFSEEDSSSLPPSLPLERFLLHAALPTLPNGSWGKNMAHFPSNMSSSHCSLCSLEAFCHLLQYLPFKITFFFHLVSSSPLCSQLPLHTSSLHPNVGGNPMEPLWSTAEKRCQICFARSLAQVV